MIYLYISHCKLLLSVLLLLVLLPKHYDCYSNRLHLAKSIIANPRLHLNRILADIDECTITESGDVTLTLNSDDYRAKHIDRILKLKVGDTIRVGILDVGISNNGTLLTNATGVAVQVSLGKLNALAEVKRMKVDLILAIPRPLRLERLLPVISMMGVDRLYLVGASKVEKDYFGSHLLRRKVEMTKCLVEGLSQSSNDCNLPCIIVSKEFDRFISEIGDAYSKDTRILRFVAHPYTLSAIDGDEGVKKLSEYLMAHAGDEVDRIVIAVGPEAGWQDDEVKQFISRHFKQIHLGSRILRTDVAVPVLLGIANEFIN